MAGYAGDERNAPGVDGEPTSGGEGERSASSDSIARLGQAIKRITATRGVSETMDVITHEARRLIGAHQAVTSRTRNQDWVQAINSVSLSDDYAQWRDYDAAPDGSGIYARVCETNQPMRLTQAELEAHPDYKRFGHESERHPPMRGWLAAPLISPDGENIGLIQLSDKYDGADFTDHDEAILTQLAQVAAVAVENARLFEITQQAQTLSEQRFREAQAERQKLAEIFQNAPSFMCILRGPEHVFERVNDRYAELIGHRDVIGRPVRQALPEIEGQGFFELLDHVYWTGQTYYGQDERVELQNDPAGGECQAVWLDIVYQPMRDSEGTVTGIYVQGIDLTGRKRIEQALRESEQHLKDANASLEGRVAERTAELEQRAAQLRALAAELTQAEQRERRRLGHMLHDHLQQLLVAGKIQLDTLAGAMDNRQTGATLRHVLDLIDQSIQESRSLTAELSPPVLYDAGLPAALESLGRWMHQQQGLRVDVHTGDEADPAGEDLRVLIYQAVRELLLNVVKHAGTDHAEVNLRRASADRIEVTVADAGRGFDPEAIDASSEQDRFGLFSMRERLAWIGGELAIDSAPDQGTCVQLAVTDDHPERDRTDHSGPPATHAESGAAAGGQSVSTTVVLADDHTIVREGLANALADHPDIAVVGEAADGREVVDLVRRVRPHVVVLDVTMPVMGGIEAARTITSEFEDVRVIGLSVHAAADVADSMRKAGAEAFLNKAEASDKLLALIRGEAMADSA